MASEVGDVARLVLDAFGVDISGPRSVRIDPAVLLGLSILGELPVGHLLGSAVVVRASPRVLRVLISLVVHVDRHPVSLVGANLADAHDALESVVLILPSARIEAVPVAVTVVFPLAGAIFGIGESLGIVIDDEFTATLAVSGIEGERYQFALRGLSVNHTLSFVLSVHVDDSRSGSRGHGGGQDCELGGSLHLF